MCIYIHSVYIYIYTYSIHIYVSHNKTHTISYCLYIRNIMHYTYHTHTIYVYMYIKRDKIESEPHPEWRFMKHDHLP